MRFDEAMRRIENRTVALSQGGIDPEGGVPFAAVQTTPEAMARGMLNGLIEGEDLEDLIAKLSSATDMGLAMISLGACTDEKSMWGTMYALLAQSVAVGLLLSADEVPA